METLIAAFVAAAIVGGVVWSRSAANAAMARVQLHVPDPPGAAATDVDTAQNAGGGAGHKGFTLGIQMTGSGNSLRLESKIGDVGHVELTLDGDGTRVPAPAEILGVDAHPRTISRRPSPWGIASRLAHLIHMVLGITSNAADLTRFLRALVCEITRRLTRTLH